MVAGSLGTQGFFARSAYTHGFSGFLPSRHCHVAIAGTAVKDGSFIGCWGTPDDIASVVLFRASDLYTIMIGSTLVADAGKTI